MTRALLSPSLAFLSLAAVLVGGCPDPEARLDEFLESSKAERDLPPPKDDLGSTLADVSGTFLFALDPVINPGLPLQFFCTTTLTPDGAGGGILTMNMQPLSLDKGSTTMPRQPVGEALLIENIMVSPEGAFSLDLGEVMVIGAANPITGSDIVATLTVEGFIQDENFFCGKANGMLIAPFEISLDNSTFGASRVDSIDALPEMFPLKCP